jgi:hypothetical protein
MVTDDRDRENVLAEAKERAKSKLKALLSEDELKTHRKHGSAEAHTFEDSARELAADGDRIGNMAAMEIHTSLEAYQDAINSLWIYGCSQEMPERMAREWLRARKKIAGHLDLEEVSSEAMYHLRSVVVAFQPDKGSLYALGRKRIFSELDTWYSQGASPVQLSRAEARVLRDPPSQKAIDAAFADGSDGSSGYNEEDMP